MLDEKNNVFDENQNNKTDDVQPAQENSEVCSEVDGSHENINENPTNHQEQTNGGSTVTEEKPTSCDNIYSYNASFSNSTAPEQGYYGGVAYTKNVDGENTSGYRWNSESIPAETKYEKKSSGKGFKIFIGSLLTIFTLSAVTLTAMVASSIITDGFRSNIETDNGKNTSSVTNPGIPASTSNYVAFDKDDIKGNNLTIPQIAAKCSPSSVGIISQVEVSYSYPFGFGTSKGVSEASGSGFIYSSDGYIITNHHVIENAKKVTVILHDGAEYEAEIIGSDSLSDIAVIKITPEKEKTLIPMEIGNSDELVVGEAVVAIGCPAGIEFIGTVTDGIISAINRNVEITDNYGTTKKTMTLIQTNATINHGNSGGPLINSRGQVIGINTLKLNSSSYEGIGFSIPMNGAMPIIKQLMEHGKVIERTQDDFAYGKGIIGISGSAISEDEAEYYNIPIGVLVVQIDKNSSAAKAGLRRGDIITHYNGKKVTTVDEINEAKGNGRAGEEVTLTLYRDSENGVDEGQTLEITFTLDAQK